MKAVIPTEKISYTCNTCGEVLKRKPTENPPHACNYCHAENPSFTKGDNGSSS